MTVPEKVVLALDPGHSKVGMALVLRGTDGRITLLWRRIAKRPELAAAMDEAAAFRPYSVLVVGSGTRSKDVIAELRHSRPGISMMLVGEENSTLEARIKYWEHHKRRGLRRLLPASFWPPSEPLDDFAALVLAERALDDSG